MSINIDLAKKAEEIARKMAIQSGQPESLWELFLIDAYKSMMPVPPPTEPGSEADDDKV